MGRQEFSRYAAAYALIQEAIASGVCYQVNHTFRAREI